MSWRDFTLRCRKTKEPFLVSRIFFRPVSLPISYLLYSLGVSADAISVLVILIGLAGVVSLVANYPLTGFILIQLSFLFDHVDGNLARCRDRSTLEGGYLDFLGHLLINPGIFFGLGAYVATSREGSWWPLVAGAVCVLCVNGAGAAAKDRIMLDAMNTLTRHMRTPAVMRTFSSKPWLEVEQSGPTTRSLEQFAANVLSEHLLFPGWLIIVPLSCVIQARLGIPTATYLLAAYTCLTAVNTIRTMVHYYRFIRAVDLVRRTPIDPD